MLFLDEQVLSLIFRPFLFLSFRLILAMDPRYGEISRAMRNRGVEIFVLGEVGFNIAPYIVSRTSEIIRTCLSAGLTLKKG